MKEDINMEKDNPDLYNQEMKVPTVDAFISELFCKYYYKGLLKVRMSVKFDLEMSEEYKGKKSADYKAGYKAALLSVLKDIELEQARVVRSKQVAG